MSDVNWGNYAEAYKAIRDKLDEILTKLDYPADPAVQDVIDRADRVLGRVYGSQGQQLKQRASTHELMVQLVHQGVEYQAGGGGGSGLVQCQIRNEADDAWINEPFARDISDRAARDLGKVDIAAFDVPLPAGTNNIGAITPSGDMARKEYYDRTPGMVIQFWESTVSAHDWTQRWSYTVPSGKKAFNYLFFMKAFGGTTYQMHIRYDLSIDGGATYRQIFYYQNVVQGVGGESRSESLPFVLVAGNILKGLTWSNMATSHLMNVSAVLLQFDA